MLGVDAAALATALGAILKRGGQVGSGRDDGGAGPLAAFPVESAHAERAPDVGAELLLNWCLTARISTTHPRV
jgi:hypothetical protein